MPERTGLPPSLMADMPPTSPELALIGAFVRAHLATMPRKKRALFMREVFSVFDSYDTGNVVRIRGREHDEAVAQSRRGAVAWTRGMMSAFLLDSLDAPPG